ncbi:MAG: hypothetical protein M3Y19_02960 [Actinomycetota bacterium]|nr:hypothetical protein [Actinomycetota bacterium]
MAILYKWDVDVHHWLPCIAGRSHQVASSNQAVDVAGLERLGATRMRQYVRAWINEWDLVRLDPAYQPATEVLDVVSDYGEQAELDSSEGD